MLIVFGFLAAAALVAVLFPDTPDELLRIEAAYGIRETGAYDNFYWPPGNVLIILANPFLGSGLFSDVVLVRLFNLAAALPLCLLLYRTANTALLIAALVVAPYTFLVLSTGSQQGLMIGLFAVLVWAITERRLWVLGLAALSLYLVNPAMILALPAALLVLCVVPWFRRAFLVACLAYLPILLTAALVWTDSGVFRPTLSENGPVNIFLGNNPDPMSPRGVGDLAMTLQGFGIENGTHLEAVTAYLTREPAAFLGNMLQKAWLYWMPWDFLRSGMGQGVSTVIFTYIALAQIVIYATFYRHARQMPLHATLFAIAFCLSAWLIYTLFFVKVRFRVPFDVLLLLSCLVYWRPAKDPGTAADT